METAERHILGSAEPLTDAERAERLCELAAWGVDLSLIWAGLDKSPTQRLEEWAAFQAFATDLQDAMKASRATSYSGYSENPPSN